MLRCSHKVLANKKKQKKGDSAPWRGDGTMRTGCQERHGNLTGYTPLAKSSAGTSLSKAPPGVTQTSASALDAGGVGAAARTLMHEDSSCL